MVIDALPWSHRGFGVMDVLLELLVVLRRRIEIIDELHKHRIVQHGGVIAGHHFHGHLALGALAQRIVLLDVLQRYLRWPHQHNRTIDLFDGVQIEEGGHTNATVHGVHDLLGVSLRVNVLFGHILHEFVHFCLQIGQCIEDQAHGLAILIGEYLIDDTGEQ